MRLLDPMQAPARPLAPPDGAGLYEAPLAGGTLRLALETVSGQPPACAAEAALRLAQAEPLLEGLEAWLAAALPGLEAPEWAWCAAAAEAPAGTAQARWAGVGVGARLMLPWALLRRLPPPPLALQWTPVAAEWVLAWLTLEAAECDALEPGGALLLSQSFEPGWPAVLRAADEPCPAGAPAAGEAEGAEHPRVRWEVRCPLPAPLPPPALLGWEGEPPPFAPDAPFKLWRLAAGQPPVAWARGRGVPWGEGRALLLDHVGPAA